MSNRSKLVTKLLVGPEVKVHVSDLAMLRITVLREYPSLYDGDFDFERRYVESYVKSTESLVVAVFDGNRAVGASTGIPLDHEKDHFKEPFSEKGMDPARVFYYGESVLLKEYRGRGLGVEFFEKREQYARALGRFDFAAFCAVERPEDHPLRPQNYVSLDEFWVRRGFNKRLDMCTSYSWRDLDEPIETMKTLVYWMKDLRSAS